MYWSAVNLPISSRSDAHVNKNDRTETSFFLKAQLHSTIACVRGRKTAKSEVCKNSEKGQSECTQKKNASLAQNNIHTCLYVYVHGMR